MLTVMPKKSSSRTKNSQNLRDLDLEITFMEGIVRRDPAYVEALRVLGDDYTQRGRFEDGLKIDKTLVQLRPTDALVHYNLACSYSLTKESSLAARHLEVAIDLGYRDFKWMARDPDLKFLREGESYERIQTKVKQIKPNP